MGIPHYRKCCKIARQDLVVWNGLQEKIPCILLFYWLTVSAHDSIEEDMVYLNALGQPIIVFNSLKPASDLLDRRANIYSDRPRLIMANEILSGGLFSSFLPYGDV